MQEPLLKVAGLYTAFHSKRRTVKAVDGVDFSLYPRQMVCLVGESGSGKSVTSLSIMRLLSEKKDGVSYQGEVLFEGRNLLGLTEREMTKLRGNEMSMIFQEPMSAMNPVFKLGRQIGEALTKHTDISKSEVRAKVIEQLRFVGIPRAEQIINEYPHQLSGGMRQRAMIAMAMACSPKLLIADEPTTALDVTIQAQVLDLMKNMRSELNTSILLITHDLGVVADMADHVVVMYAGQVVESVDADTLFNTPLHPYTKCLMSAIPSLTVDKEELYAIPGTVPDPASFPKGCRFADRCPIAKPDCFESAPALREVTSGHFVRCDYA